MRKLTRTEANFENLLEAALLVEGHCSHAEHGCSCRGCDECEENYMMESEEEEKESLASLIGKYVEGEDKPNTDVPYGDDPEADKEKYDIPDEENDELNLISTGMEIATRAPDRNRLGRAVSSKRAQDLMTAADSITKGILNKAREFEAATKPATSTTP